MKIGALQAIPPEHSLLFAIVTDFEGIATDFMEKTVKYLYKELHKHAMLEKYQTKVETQRWAEDF
ncbi:MAG: hypothetical protein GX171_09685 [Clostridiales bacterium]|nr:hypothetical protein [Clostridiales bacterium]